jgi:hypothetical protein
MAKRKFLITFVLTLLSAFFVEPLLACSMYKITAGGKTMVGNNEDSWGQDPCIWFVQGDKDHYGVVCVGYARKQPKPDGAMNEYGLAFDAFSMPHKGTLGERDPAKKDFAYSDLLTIMQKCKTVDEVYAFFDTLNMHILDGSPLFHGGMFLFVDKTGKYLVVEADKMMFGNDDKFVLANFSYCGTRDLSTVKIERYRKGVAYLRNKPLQTDLAFCTSLSDTMSVNRSRVGDGTLYTNIYDLEEGLIYLYFYHDFSRRVTFNLKEELSKGNHSYRFAELFPGNINFLKFLNYKTPQNNPAIFVFLTVCGFVFFFSFVSFLISFFRSRKTRYRFLKAILSLLSLALTLYAWVLIRNEGIYYFPAPYSDGQSLMVSITSYLPFVLLIAIIPFLLILVNIFRNNGWKAFSKYLFLINMVLYVVLIAFFIYWQLFDVF